MTHHEPHQILVVITANPRGDLPGCDEDGTRMARCLPDFEVWWCRRATRRDIFALFRRLRRVLRSGSVLVVYLSGHGGLARFPAGFGPGFPPELEWPFFVTADQERDEIFHSILALELSSLVGQCASVTANTTVIIDTCFAQGLLRSRVRLRSTGRRDFAVPTHIVAEHEEFTTYAAWIVALRTTPRLASLLDESVVCVSAAATGQPAYESVDGQGRPGGAFTIELCGALPDARARRVCWQQLISIVRQRLVDRWGEGFQRPEVTGPSGRRLFQLGSVDIAASTSAFLGAGDSLWIRSGRLHGTAIGDLFAARGPLGFVELGVVEVLEDRARLDANAAGVLPAGSLVFPHRCVGRLAVALDEDCPQRALLGEMLAGGMRVTACAPGDRPALRVGRHPDGLAICAENGRLERISSVARVLADLDALARACAFEAVMERAPESCPGADLSWRVIHGRGDHERELMDGDAVVEGDRLWLEVVNRTRSEIPGLYINLIERGADGRLRVLNSRQHPAGVQVRDGAIQRVLWYPEGPHGRRQVWPSDVPRDVPRQVVWYLVASPVPLDLRAVAADPARGGRAPATDRRDIPRALESTLERPGEAVRPAREPRIRWDRRRLGFLLSPR